MAFKDHFSVQADRYTRFRPRYPRRLFEFLATLPARPERAWDCRTGNCQAALGLGEYFAEVVATGPSARQIAHAEKHPKVRYLISAAEQPPLANDSVDLITVAQALHWFDLERFYAEVRRVARPGGVVAAWGYELATITPVIDQVVRHLYSDLLGKYWPPERQTTETRYATVAFPFRELPGPTLESKAQWHLDALQGYLGTWSSVQKYIEWHAANPLDQAHDDLAAVWGSPERIRRVTWPLFLRVGRIE